MQGLSASSVGPEDSTELPIVKTKHIVIDLETSDPDDVWNLLLIGGHPMTDLRGVTVYPGTPAQLLLVHYVLEQLSSAHESLAYLKGIPIGYHNIDQDLIGGGSNEAGGASGSGSKSGGEPEDANLSSMLNFTKGQYYRNQHADWFNRMKDITPKASGKKPKTAPEGATGADPILQRTVKSKVLSFLEESNRPVRQGADLLIEESNKVLSGPDGANELVYMTGGPVSNLGDAVELSKLRRVDPAQRHRVLRLKRWVGQGGFAGKNVVGSNTPKLARFFDNGKPASYNPAWNFDLDHRATIAALNADRDMISEKYITSKNVCHRVTLGFPANNEEGVGIGVDVAEIKTAYDNRQGLQGHFIPSRGLGLFINALAAYEGANNKKLHDLVAGVAAVHLGYSGVIFRKVLLHWNGTEDSAEDEDETAAEKRRLHHEKEQATQNFRNARNKNGGEWGCQSAKGPAVAFNLEEKPFKKDVGSFQMDHGDGMNVLISVDIDLDVFLKGLVGSEVAEQALEKR